MQTLMDMTGTGGNLDSNLGNPAAHPQKEVKRMMEVTEKPNGGYHVKINSSSLDVIQTCLRKSQFVLRDGLVNKEPGLAVTFGSGIHKALEIFYFEPRENRVLPPAFKDKIQMMCAGNELENENESFIYRAVRGFLNETQEILGGLPSDDKRSLMNGGWLLSEYFESRISDPYEVYLNNGKPCIETTYEATLHDTPELTIDVFGTVDAILENKANEQLVVCDHKTTSATNMNDFYNRTKPNLQYSCYIWLVQTALNLPTENFMINCFQVKARPKTNRGAGPNFLNIITKRTPEDLVEFKRSVIWFVQNYLQCLENDYFPIGTANACSNYGKCDFLDVCSSPASIQPNILSANFKKRGT